MSEFYLDALYLNFISGFELTLEQATFLRHGFPGPIYADLHSLLLGVGQDGFRTPQPLQEPVSWYGCFDAVQVNEEEMALLPFPGCNGDQIANVLERLQTALHAVRDDARRQADLDLFDTRCCAYRRSDVIGYIVKCPFQRETQLDFGRNPLL